MPETKICQSCEAENPPTNKFCGQCGLKLVDAPLPTENSLPAWLQQTPSEPPRQSRESAEPASHVEPDQELPAWLREAESLPEASQSEFRDQSESAAKPSAPRADSEYDLPEWLRDAEPAAAPEIVAADHDPATQTTLPAWLTDSSHDDAPAHLSASQGYERVTERIQDEQAVARLTGAHGDATAAPATDRVEHDVGDLPRWLSDVGDEDREPDHSTMAPANGYRADVSLPGWLTGSSDPATNEPTPGQIATHTPAEAPELPAWLREMDGPPKSPAEIEPAQAGGSELPGWLSPVDEEDAPDHPVGVSGATTIAERPPEPESALPAWLRDDDLHSADDPDSTVDVPDAQPSWLHVTEPALEAHPVADEAPTGWRPPDAERAAATSLPAWLADLDLDTEERPVEQRSQTRLPSWLTDPLPSEVVGATTKREDTLREGVPVWLREEENESPGLAPVSDLGPEDRLWQPADPASGASNAPAAAETPDWLRDTSHQTEGDAQDLPPPPRSDLPKWPEKPGNAPGADTYSSLDWLTDTGPEPAAGGTGAGQPAWLQAMQANASASAGTGTGASTIGRNVARIYSAPGDVVGQEVPADGDSILPPWLADVKRPDTVAEAPVSSWLDEAPEQQPAGAGGSGQPGIPFPAHLDLPAWLQNAPPAPVASEPQPAEGSSDFPAWLGDAEPAPVAIAGAPVAPPVVRSMAAPMIERSPERIAAMELLERLIIEPAQEPTSISDQVAEPRWSKRLSQVFQILAFLILLAAIILILLGPRLPLGLGSSPATPTPGAGVAERLTALATGAPVLVAYEWDGSRAAEMAALENVLIEQLTSQRSPLMLMATDPQGVLQSRRRAVLLRQRGDNFYDKPGLGFVDLGYKPGGSIALARMAGTFSTVFESDWSGHNLLNEPTVIRSMCQVRSGNGPECELGRVGMLLVFADESEDVRVWTEQVASAVPDVPITFATPAEIAPLARPYITRENMLLVSGIEGAATVQAELGGRDDALGRRADAAAVGKAVFGLVALLGVLPSLWSGRQARRAGKGSGWAR